MSVHNQQHIKLESQIDTIRIKLIQLDSANKQDFL